MKLYSIYKLIKQRSARHPDNRTMKKITEICRSMFDGQKDRNSLIAILDKVIELEKSLPSHLKRYGLSMKEAVLSASYTLDRPHEIAHVYNEKSGSDGQIYVLSSPDKPGQVKLGATTMNLRKRCDLYEYKYGYPVKIEKALRVRTPFKLEDAIQKLTISQRVTGLACGDSIEWYFMRPSEMWDIVNNTNKTLMRK